MKFPVRSTLAAAALLAGLLAGLLPASPALAQDIEAGVLKGTVVDARGAPLKGAEIVADNTLLYNSNALGVSKADGSYRIPTNAVAGTYRPSAQLKRKFNGKTYTFALETDDDAPFDGAEGAVRNFTWKLTGEYGDNRRHGSTLLFYFGSYEDPQNNEAMIRQEDVEFTLKPVGPLIDGSEGQTITRRGEATGDGFGVPDLAIARYQVEARYAAEGTPARPLLVRVRGKDDYAPSVTADFVPMTSLVQFIEIEVKLPGAT